MQPVSSVVVVGGGTAGLIAALTIREKYPYIKITIIRSNEIGIVGVGEGSTEHWKTFCDFVGIDVKDLIKNCRSTIKIGILFDNWNGDGKRYVHNVDFLSEVSSLGRHDVYNLALCQEGNDEFPLSRGFEHYFIKNNVPMDYNIYCSNQFHFDTFKLNTYLSNLCKNRDINFVEDNVIKTVLNDSGSIVSLNLENNEPISGDFFVDCSGFKRLLAKDLDNKWLSKKDYLPLNRAIAFPLKHDKDAYEPYTQAIALKSGWMWRIPTQDRYGNGYVFSSNYISDEEALIEASAYLNQKIDKFRCIPFEAGCLEKFWVKNCVFIGLSSSFAEPLEAQSIGFSIVQSMNLIHYLEAWHVNKEYITKIYNQKLGEIFDNIIDYLQAHYFTKREDSKFWKDKPFILTNFNKETFDIFCDGYILPSMFNQNSFFKSSNFYQVYNGLGLINIQNLKVNLQKNREIYRNFLAQKLVDYIQKSKKSISIDHKLLLNILNTDEA